MEIREESWRFSLSRLRCIGPRHCALQDENADGEHEAAADPDDVEKRLESSRSAFSFSLRARTRYLKFGITCTEYMMLQSVIGTLG